MINIIKDDRLHTLAELLVDLGITNGHYAEMFLNGADMTISLQDLLKVVDAAPGVL